MYTISRLFFAIWGYHFTINFIAQRSRLENIKKSNLSFGKKFMNDNGNIVIVSVEMQFCHQYEVVLSF